MQRRGRQTDVEGEVPGSDVGHVPTSRTAAGGEGGITMPNPEATTGLPKTYRSSTKLMIALLAGNVGVYFCLVGLARLGLISGSLVDNIRDYITLLAR